MQFRYIQYMPLIKAPADHRDRVERYRPKREEKYEPVPKINLEGTFLTASVAKAVKSGGYFQR